jgi:large subunit ribosomal protein L24
MKKVRKDDQVMIIAGKDRGKQGKIIRVIGDRVLVEGVNMVKKHQRPNPQKGVQGGIISKEASIHISNVALYNSATKKADRVGIKALADGQKVRYFKSNDEVIG